MSHTPSYELGYKHGCEDAQSIERAVEHKARAEAFGAIRRAAAVAREWDMIFADDFVDEREHGITAEEIRRAIRAAIGSDKT